MINVIKQTPIEYSKQSRDYQVIARLYTALYNFNLMYIDDMNVWNSNIDNKLTMLRAKTLNFHPKHAWGLDALDAAMSCFKYIMRLKGTKEAIEYCIQILLRINKLEGKPEITFDDNYIIIAIPMQLASMGIVEDLLELILPAGMKYRIMEYKHTDSDIGTQFYGSTRIDSHNIPTINLGIYAGTNENPKYGVHYIDENGEPVWPETSSEGVDNQGTNLYYNNVINLEESSEDEV